MKRISSPWLSRCSWPETELQFGFALLVVVSITLFAYWPGLTGPLVLDDYANLSALGDNGGITSWRDVLAFVFGNDSGPTGRPVAMLAFLIDAQDWPPAIAAFKYTNLLIHVLTGITLCWLAYWLFQALAVGEQRAAWLALGVAALWLVHPLNAATTLYIVQRMTQLMTLFALASLLCYVKGRILITRGQGRAGLLLLAAFFPLALLAVLSKENGALVLALVVVLELSVFRAVERTRWVTWWFRGGVLAPLTLIGVYLLLTLPGALEGYAYRDFTLAERLLTETRVLCSYLFNILIPSPLAVGLYHDDLVVSTSLLAPVTTLFSCLTLLGVAVAAWHWRNAHPMLFLAVGWFFSMQFLESTYLPLELVFEHRNYLAMIGPLFAVVWYGYHFLGKVHALPVVRVARIALVMVFVFITSTLWQIAVVWSDAETLHAYWSQEKPESSRAQITYAEYLATTGNPRAALAVLEQARALHPDEITIQLQLWNTACAASLEPPITLQSLVTNTQLDYKHNDINFHMRALLENYLARACDFPPAETLAALFQRAIQLPMSPRRKAGLHYLFAELYITTRQLDAALVQLSQAYRLSPLPEIPYRQALLSASAGNYADSLVFLERARQADASRNPLLPSLEPEIARMEADIRNLLDATN